MSSLRGQVLGAEARFLEALSDRRGIETFEEFWSALVHDVQLAISHGAIDEDTVAQYHNTARLVEDLSQNMIEFCEDVETIDAAFRQDVAVHLERTGFPSSPPEALPTRRDVSLAARWLSRNYHNPYPSNMIRDDISRRANWNRKDVDAWFTEARKRIGWNDIRKRFFHNKRAATIEKATHFFRGSQSSVHPGLAQAFVDMESQVQDLYINPFKPSLPAMALDSTCRYSTPGVDRGDPSGGIVTSRTSTPLCLATFDLRPPSPISRSVSPTRVSSKRHRSDTLEENDTENEFPKKRARAVSRRGGSLLPPTQLPSPATSQSDLAEQTPEATATEVLGLGATCTRSASLTSLPNPELGRSPSGAQVCPRYPSLNHGTPGLQTTSASLPSPIPSQQSTSPELSTTPYLRQTTLSSPPLLIPQTLAIAETQSSAVHELLSQAGIPELSFEFPDSTTCDQPVGVQTVDMTLFHAGNLYDSRSCIPGVNGNYFPAASTLLGSTSQRICTTENVDVTSLSSLLNNSLDGDQLLGLLPPPFIQNDVEVTPARAIAPPDLTEVDIGFGPFLSFDAGQPPQLPHLQVDDLFLADFVGSFSSSPPPVDTKKDKQIAHLEMLKQHQDHLQECIQSLERQLATRVCA